MTIHHHPDETLLADWVAGRLAEPVELAIEAHLTWCEQCRQDVARLQEAAGMALEMIEPVPLAEGSLDKVLAMLGEQDPMPSLARVGTSDAASWDPRIPAPIWKHVKKPLEQLDWTNYGIVSEFRFLENNRQHTTKLLRIAPGRSMPSHTHKGTELTLVLSGRFRDEMGDFGPGDFVLADEEVDHRPVVDSSEYCYCLTITDGPLHFTGTIGRLLNPIINRG